MTSHSPFDLVPPEVALELLPTAFRQYSSPSGEQIFVDTAMDALKVLGIPDTSGKNGQIAFRKLVKNPSRQARVDASIAYIVALKRPVSTVHLMAAAGHTKALQELGALKPNILHAQDEYGRTPLYLAARSGFVDLCTYLLNSQRCDVNAQQGDGSTALHAACFFGQRPVAEMLLEAGAKPDTKNGYGNTPADETSDAGMKLVLFSGLKSALLTLRQECVDAKVVGSFTELTWASTKTPIGFVAHRPVNKDLLAEFQQYPLAFHGTKAKHVVSILKNGLRPSGSTLPDGSEITPPEGHYKLGSTHGGIKDWARAVFLSPSVTYAAHPAYAEAVLDGNSARYRVVVIARVNQTRLRSTAPLCRLMCHCLERILTALSSVSPLPAIPSGPSRTSCLVKATVVRSCVLISTTTSW